MSKTVSKTNTKGTKNKSPKSRKPKTTSQSVKSSGKKNVQKKKSFITELIENVEYGAKLFGEKTSEIATETFEKVKQGASEAIDTSSQVVTDLYSSASDYADQFKDKIEMKKLNNQREELVSNLGAYFYKNYKIDKITFSKLSKTSEFTSLIKKIQRLDKEIIELGKDLSK